MDQRSAKAFHKAASSESSDCQLSLDHHHPFILAGVLAGGDWTYFFLHAASLSFPFGRECVSLEYSGNSIRVGPIGIDSQT